ncbi:MAG: tetratricopeptide repeat protein, partial [Bryobacterales bacterium]|nr:tetratricopeptide repeat protein [Bryobacterales bacterium]
MATFANNLGLFYRALGSVDAAREHAERAMRINESVYGTKHPAVAVDANNLGQVHKDLGTLNTAREYTEHALGLVRRCTALTTPMSRLSPTTSA